MAHLGLRLIWIQYFFNITSDFIGRFPKSKAFVPIFVFRPLLTHLQIVVILPLPIIWRLIMPTEQKLAVTGICGLAIITIAFDTLRTVKLYSENFALTGLYSYLELVVAVLTSMLPSYRFLVSSSDKGRGDLRHFLNRITRSRSSNSSGYSMNNANSRSSNRPERVANNHLTIPEPTPPLPVFQQL